MQKLLTEFAIRRPKMIMVLGFLITLGFLAAFPSLKTDTDPIKMLPADNPAITLYKQVKKDFAINDLVVLGIKSKNGDSLFTPGELAKIHAITEEILEIQEPPAETSFFSEVFKKMQFLKDHDQVRSQRIFIKEDVIALSVIDDIVKTEAGELSLEPLMGQPPQTQAEASAILDKLNGNPIFAGKLAAEDGSLVGIYLPLEPGKKDRAYYLGQRMKEIAQKHLGEEQTYYLAGLPIAENTFGNEMFVQMGVYAPAAGVVIFLLMLFFFRSIKLVAAPMLLGMMVVIWSMGALIYSGNSIHIMSSMIPIFLLPIAVLNSIHILSRLHDNLANHEAREDAIRHVMKQLFNPMLFTSVTTIVGFVSLATTGIPPVVVFGVTVGFGVFLSWLLSMIFIPAYFSLLSEDALKNFGKSEEDKKSVVMEVVQMFKGIANQAPHVVIAAAVLTLGIAAYGLPKIIINDNPVRWFKDDHFLRQADQVMNNKLAGTYLANLVFTAPKPAGDVKAPESETGDAFGSAFDAFDEPAGAPAPSIKDPQVIAYMEQLSQHLQKIESAEGARIVGGVVSLVDILKKIGTVAYDDPSLPTTREQVGQYMFLFESGDRNRGKDMWKFVTRGEADQAQMWVLFKSGDNQTTIQVVEAATSFMAENPPPTFTLADGSEASLKVEWSGLTYINKVWQDEMVEGMIYSLIGSFGIVFAMMVFLFRSVLWGLISMLPLTLTIMMIYGGIGYTGTFYDMPIAVLSSLTLGLSVDFAIHFIESTRDLHKETKDGQKTFFAIFDGTAQAIWRNVLVISIGFTPLFFSGLVPYMTVGSFFFAIMLVSGITTLILLPAIIRLYHRFLPGLKPSVQSASSLRKSA
ncbi:MAG: efflux RND transporter permease subunit [bacterium]|nr:efflux RND transporter permease subunit [bacterium]